MTTLTKSEFAAVMGVDRAQPTRWEKLGMPTLPGGKLDPVKAAAWVRANIDPRQREGRGLSELTQPASPARGTLAEERTRVAHAQANALERDNRVKEGELIERTAAEAVFFDCFRATRDAWLNWPVVTGPLLATDLGVDAEKVTHLLVEHVHRQLVALGEPEPEFAGGADAA